MQVGVLGPLLVEVDARDVTPRGQRLRDVLVVLLQRRGRSVPAEVVLDLVWGSTAPGLDASVVHTVIARLRRYLGPGAIGSDGVGYLVDRGVTTDEDAFTDLLSIARSSLDGGDLPAARRHYRAAIDTWRGPEAFAGASAGLVEADRSRLAELRTVATEELAAVLLDHPELGGPNEALALTAELIAANPLRERPCQLGMLAAYRCDRQAEALAMFRDLRHRLIVDLGIEPTRTSAELYSKILRQDPALGPISVGHRPEMERSAVRPGAAGPPAPVTPLIGRTAELQDLLDALAQGRRLVTVVGPGGVGKSRLLIEVGARRQEMKGILYAEMSGLVEVGPDEIAGTIAVGRFALDPRRAPVESLITVLADGNWLLLIDEAEWVVEPLVPVLIAILAGCPGVQIVVTSRIPLDVAGEYLIAIEPLRVPEADDGVLTIMESPAVQFLARRLTDRAVPVGQDDDTALLLASIARRVDGLPLALELAAGQASGRSLADIAVLVESLLDVPATQRSANARHRSLRDTLDWSMSRLTPDHRAVLRRLSVFVGPFDLADAAAICGSVADVDQVVRSLVREALVNVERTGATRTRFRLLRTVRDLAAEGLGFDELAATQALHRRWHAGLWRAGCADLVEGVRENLDDYVEALRTAVDSRDASTLADLTLTMAEYWRYTGGQVVGLKWIARVFDTDVLGAQDRARVHAQRAALALHHFPDFVLDDTAAAIAVLESDPDEPLLVLAHIVRAVELSSRGLWDGAVDHVDTAVGVARRAAGEPLIKALSTQANVQAVIGDQHGATAAIDEVRSLIDESTPAATRIIAHTNIGLAMVNLERPADALHLLDVVRPDVQRVTGRRPPDFYLLCQGWAELGCGAWSSALNTFSASVPARAPGIADRQSAETYLGVGCALAELGSPAAAGALAAALELSNRVQLTIPPVFARSVMQAIDVAGPFDSILLSGEPTGRLLERLQLALAEAV